MNNVQTNYHPPKPPDMLPNGTPHISILRSSRARQVNYQTSYDEDRTTEPIRKREGLLRRILRGIAARWLPLSFGMLLIFGLYAGYRQWVQPTWQSLQAQWHTGDGRIVQLDANVGHGGMSHFLAQYYQGHIVVIEIQVTNPGHMHTYSVPALTPGSSQQDLTLSVSDVNHDGRPDLVIQEGSNTMAIVLYNTGSGFSEAQP